MLLNGDDLSGVRISEDRDAGLEPPLHPRIGGGIVFGAGGSLALRPRHFAIVVEGLSSSNGSFGRAISGEERRGLLNRTAHSPQKSLKIKTRTQSPKFAKNLEPIT